MLLNPRPTPSRRCLAHLPFTGRCFLAGSGGSCLVRRRNSAAVCVGEYVLARPGEEFCGPASSSLPSAAREKDGSWCISTHTPSFRLYYGYTTDKVGPRGVLLVNFDDEPQIEERTPSRHGKGHAHVPHKIRRPAGSRQSLRLPPAGHGPPAGLNTPRLQAF